MPKLRTRLTVALISAATIALELMWMRVLALRFWHHFSYLIIATALLGFGVSGTVLTLGRRFILPRRRQVLWAVTLLFCLAVPITVRAAEAVPLNVQFLSWDFWQAGLLLIELIFLTPLLLAGTAVGVALLDRPERIGGHYAANLVGSGAGAALAVVLLGPLTTPQVILALAGLAYVGALVLTPWKRVGAAATAVVVGIALAGLHWLWPWAPGMSQYKMLSWQLLKPDVRSIYTREGPLGRIDVLAGESLHADPPGLSWRGDEPIPPHLLLTVDGDDAAAVYAAGPPAGYAFMDETTSALPYHLLSRPAVLILGAGGGADIGLALLRQCRRIVAVEMNPQIISLMTGPLRDAGGGVYLAPGVEIVNQEARGYLAAGSEQFDLIQFPHAAAGSSSAGVYAGQESYLYTADAFRQMLRRLSPGGMICITCQGQVPPRDGLRMLATAAVALGETTRSPADYLAMIRSRADTVTLLIGRDPLSPDRLAGIRAFCSDRGFDLCFLPDLKADEVNRFHQLTQRADPSDLGAGPEKLRPRAFYYEGAVAILGPQKEKFLAENVFDVRPITDDRPYFFHFLRLRALPGMVRQLGNISRAYMEPGYLLLLATLVQSVPVAAVLIVLPLAFRVGRLRRTPGKARAFAYFLLIGAGFMFLEMCFLQRLTLYLAHPLYSAAVVIGSFLVFAGVGSQLSTRWRRPERVTRRAGLLVAALVVVYVFALGGLLDLTQPWAVWARAAVVAAAVAPLAVAMGHMFPAAMRSLGLAGPALVPWCWAINGFASVVATVGASLVAMEIGFTALTALGAAAYLAAALVRPSPPAS